MTNQRYLSREEAAEFLSVQGLRVSPLTLAKWATTGGGPLYQKFGRRALYEPQNLLSWAGEKLSAPRASSSEAA